MPKKEISKSEARKEIEEFFHNLKQKSPKQVKKIKRLTMRNRISLKDYRKFFCKKCLAPYSYPKTRIKNGMKSVECQACKEVSRWKIK